MPATSAGDLSLVMAWEDDLRTNRRRLDPIRPDRMPPPAYWQQVLALFEIHRQIGREPGHPVTPDAPAAARWPDRTPATIATGRPRRGRPA